MPLSDSLLYSAKPSDVKGHKYRQKLPTYKQALFPERVHDAKCLMWPQGPVIESEDELFEIQGLRHFRHHNGQSSRGKQATIALDYFVSSLITRLEIYHGFNLLEQIHEHGLLHTLWTDMTGCSDAHITTGNVLKVMRTSARVGDDLAVSISRVYNIPILSGIIGCMQNK